MYLTALVFALIGLQLPSVLEGIRNVRPAELALDAVVLIGLLIVLRMLWVYAVSWIAFAIRKQLVRPAVRPRANEVFIIGWTGMRGVIALAAAMSLPELTSAGVAFPQRDLLIFLTFVVILVTLVAQGLSLPFLIGKLRVTQHSA